jgi:subtilisin family serine protease
MRYHHWRMLSRLAFCLGLAVYGCGGTPDSAPADTSEPPTQNDNTASENPPGAGLSGPSFVEDANPELEALPYVEDEIIAVTLPGVDSGCADAAFAAAGVQLQKSLPGLRSSVVRVTRGTLADAAATLRGDPVIERVQKNYRYAAQRTPNDSVYSDQAHWVAAAFPEAWSQSTGHADTLIAVLDTGVDAAHPDLVDRVRAGWNTFNDSDDVSDPIGHGTAVVGILGASTDNARGVAGATWAGQVLVVRVGDDEGIATGHTIAAGIVWAAEQGAKVINVSFAPLQGDATVAQAVTYAEAAGALVCISSGNDGKTSSTGDDPLALFVGARTGEGTLAAFSSRGPFVDLAAPGVAIWTTARGGNYAAMSGTSFASPIVAGAAALIRALRPDFSPATVREILLSTADDFGPAGRDEGYGAGGLNAGAALAAAAVLDQAADNVAPRVEIRTPADGAELAGIAALEVDASDDASGIASVVLSVDGVRVAGDAFAPYLFSLDLRGIAPGEHVLQISASDRAGNVSTPAEIRIVAQNATVGANACVSRMADTAPPTVRIAHPADGSDASRSIGVRAVAADDVALSGATLLVDNVVVDTLGLHGPRAEVDFVWDASTADAGEHRITIRIADLAGGVAESSITVIKR